MIRNLLTVSVSLAALGVPAASASTPETANVERIAADRLAISWSDTGPIDVFVSKLPDATIGDATLVSGDDRDGRHELSVGSAERPYILLRKQSGDIVRVAERAVDLEQGSNFRDIGGYPAADGKHVRWGLIYRSGGTPLLTEADVAEVQSLGIQMFDLRSTEERVIAPTRVEGVPYMAIGYSMTSMADVKATDEPWIGRVYRNFPTRLAPHMRLLFAELIDGGSPVAYNCSAGQDRTGFTTAMILSALGVPRDIILEDFHLSTTYRRPEYEMPKIDPVVHAGNPAAMFFAKYQQDPAAAKPKPLMEPDGTPFLAYSFDEIEKRWGSVEAYLEKEAGVGPAQLAALRARYLQ